MKIRSDKANLGFLGQTIKIESYCFETDQLCTLDLKAKTSRSLIKIRKIDKKNVAILFFLG
jgi:hypothetical protein